MKDAEDEAFEEIERRQGGFQAKRKMAANKLQELVECLDCGSHNVGVPANYDLLVDSVKAQPAQEQDWKTLPPKDAPLVQWAKKQTAPPQRPWILLSDADIAEVVDTTCQYTGGYEEYLIKKAERKIRSINNG